MSKLVPYLMELSKNPPAADEFERAVPPQGVRLTAKERSTYTRRKQTIRKRYGLTPADWQTLVDGYRDQRNASKIIAEYLGNMYPRINVKFGNVGTKNCYH